MSVLWILVVAGALAVLQSLLFSLTNLRRIHYTRRFSRATAYEGETVELIEVIRNAKPFPVPWLRVESRISPFLRFGRGGADEEREIAAQQYHRSAFFLGPMCQVTRRHEVTCLKRGHYDVGSVALTAGDLVGLSVKSRQLTLPCELDVYPRILSEQELSTPSTRWQGELPVRRWIMPDPFLTAGIRDYRPGDPLRDVHWRATARMGTLQVKVRDYTADPRVMVVLNVQTSEKQWGDLMDYEQEGVEQGIRIAATLCMRALGAGVEAGFASNACLIGEKGEGKTVFVPARRSQAQANILLGTMARLLIHRETSFNTFLDELCLEKGIDVVILSAYDSEELRARMARLTRNGNSATLLRLERGKRDAQTAS